mmetsp:Transcript_49234/g.136515  ORF Transcript_49234/g.136515 Transcript_49234/m.136515 type:complete len:209 (+) Transcript_49234:1396-2022(+)
MGPHTARSSGHYPPSRRTSCSTSLCPTPSRPSGRPTRRSPPASRMRWTSNMCARTSLRQPTAARRRRRAVTQRSTRPQRTSHATPTFSPTRRPQTRSSAAPPALATPAGRRTTAAPRVTRTSSFPTDDARGMATSGPRAAWRPRRAAAATWRPSSSGWRTRCTASTATAARRRTRRPSARRACARRAACRKTSARRSRSRRARAASRC